MSAAHTPGPWLIDENRWDGAVTIINDRHEPVLSAAWEGGSQTSLRVSEADLRLIAAAPALLEALETVVSHCRELEQMITEELHHAEFCGESIVLCNARDVISLAKGEAQ